MYYNKANHIARLCKKLMLLDEKERERVIMILDQLKDQELSQIEPADFDQEK